MLSGECSSNERALEDDRHPLPASSLTLHVTVIDQLRYEGKEAAYKYCIQRADVKGENTQRQQFSCGGNIRPKPSSPNTVPYDPHHYVNYRFLKAGFVEWIHTYTFLYHVCQNVLMVSLFWHLRVRW